MKVVYQTCCGVDAHKSFLVATIIKTSSGVQPSYQKKRFSTFNKSILEFKQWLKDNSCYTTEAIGNIDTMLDSLVEPYENAISSMLDPWRETRFRDHNHFGDRHRYVSVFFLQAFMPLVRAYSRQQ